MGGEGKFKIDLEDEVVQGSIVLHGGVPLPPVPRTMPPQVTPLPTPKEAATQTLAITPWQKACREVALVTGGMGSTIALGKASGMAFMDSFFTFGLAGLVGYRRVYSTFCRAFVLSLHFQGSVGCRTSLAFTTHECDQRNIGNGRNRRSLRHGWWIFPRHYTTNAWSFGCATCQRECCWWFRHHQTHVGHVQACVLITCQRQDGY
jgi:hypothetical protein